jgi:hypothetical protein
MRSATRPSAAFLGAVTGVGLGAGWLAMEAGAQPAVDIASRTGEIIGAAEACGMPAGDLISVGYVVIGWAREQARSRTEVRRARAAHEAAVTRGATRIQKEGPGACAAATAAFRDLQAKAQTSAKA